MESTNTRAEIKKKAKRIWIAAFDGEEGISERFEEGIELLTELLDEDEDGQPGVWAQCAWISELTD